MSAKLKAEFNLNQITKLRQRTREAKPTTLTLGVTHGVYKNGATTIQVAWWQNFGTKNKDGTWKIQPTYFLQRGLEENKNAIEKDIEDILYGFFVKGEITYEGAIKELCNRIEDHIKARMAEKGPKRSGLLMHSIRVTYEFN